MREERVRGVLSVVEDFELRALGCEVRAIPVPPLQPLSPPLPLQPPVGPDSSGASARAGSSVLSGGSSASGVGHRQYSNLAHLHLVARDFVDTPNIEQLEQAISFIDQVCTAPLPQLSPHQILLSIPFIPASLLVAN